MAKYDDIMTIQKFGGINQACDGDNINPAYATLGANFDTAHGGLKAFNCRNLIPGPYATPQTGHEYDPEEYIDHSIALTNEGPDAQERATLMFMHRRWTTDSDTVVRMDTNNNTYQILIVDNKLYWRRMYNGQFAGVAWNLLINPDSEESEPFYFGDNVFDWTSYEMNFMPPETISQDIVTEIYTDGIKYVYFDKDNGFDYYTVKSDDGVLANAYYTDLNGTDHVLGSTAKVRLESPAPVDCLLFTNDYDGMFCVWVPLFGSDDDLHLTRVHVGPADADSIQGNCVARHFDRIWVAGIQSDPDKCIYSVVRDAFNWEQDEADPANGAGDIQQPTWDGDEIAAIKEFGNNLLVIKHYSIWRIIGSSPDEFQYRKQYGEGTIAEDTFAVNNSVAYMLTDDDVKVYDGNGTQHFKYGAIKDVLMAAHLDPGNDRYTLYAGRMLQDKYILYLQQYMNSGQITPVLIVYDTVEGTVNVEQVPALLTLEVDNDKLYGIFCVSDPTDTSHPIPDSEYYYTSFVQMAEFFTRHWSGSATRGYTSGFKPHTLPVSWESSWLDLSAKNVAKSGFIVYLLFKPVDELIAAELAEATVQCTVTIKSEKRTKSKTVTLPFNKMKRVRVNLNARAFKLKLEIPQNNYRWRIGTGVNIYLEYDAD